LGKSTEAVAILDAQQALKLWHSPLLAGVQSDQPDLSVRQMAVLLSVYLEPPPHSVRHLAASLAISKPAVTRALDRLESHEFVRRATDDRDRRSIIVLRTIKGSVYLRELADHIVRAFDEIAGGGSEE
jgi:DNA-binding MarR family transcriptional regulator